MHLNNEKLKQSIFLLALFALGAFLIWTLRGFVSGFLGAVVFYVVLRRPYFYLTEVRKKKWNKYVAIVALMFSSFVVLILPMIFLSWMLTEKVSYFLQHYEEFLRVAQNYANRIGGYFGIDLLTTDTISQLTTLAAGIVPRFLSATLSIVVDIFMLYFILFFMLSSARKFEKTVRENLPFNDTNDALLLRELKSQTVSNAIGIPVLALIQGISAWLGYLIFGVSSPLLWAAVTGLFSVVPVIGTLAVWIPLSIILLATGNYWQGTGLLIYGFVIIGNIDNVVRLVLQSKIGDIHPLVTLFGVIIGIDLFGFVGVIFGPLLISYFLLLIRIYKNEYAV